MTLPTTKTFSQVIIEINTGTALAPVWTAPCGFTSKSSTMSASTSSASVPDCDDPEAPAWDVKGVDTITGQVQGSGVMASENSVLWEEWFDTGLPKTIRIRVVDVGYRVGPALLTSLGNTVALKSNGNLVQRAITLDAAGPWPFTSGDPT